MKKFIIFSILTLPGLISFAQIDTLQKQGIKTYTQLRDFLITQKFNNKSFQQQFEEWFTIAGTKEPAAAILVNDNHVIQSMPANYGAKDLMWISPSKRYSYRDNYDYINSSLGNQIMQDVIYDVGNNILKNIGKNKYRYSAAENNKPYHKPSFLQF